MTKSLVILIVLILQGVLLSFSNAAVLQFVVNYPSDLIDPLVDQSIFWLYVCYMPGCPKHTAWNQSGPSFTIYASDSIGNDAYQKNISLPDFQGDVYVTITGTQDAATGKYSVVPCPMGNGCSAIGVPYYTKIASIDSVAVIRAYPYFNVLNGQVYTIFHNFYSPQLNNYRDISVFVPPSVSQNSLRRKVNCLVVNDGTLLFLQQLTTLGGFDRAVQTGAVPQDTILIGVPQNASDFCERMFELSFEACAAEDTVCRDCATGGNFLLFDFIEQQVVPAVLANLSMLPGEVAMTGYSLGGLTACVAASFRPDYFQRAFCISPSVWWNHGGLANNITANAQKVGLPKAVVLYIGTDEAIQWPHWFADYNATVNAWLTSGMNTTNCLSFSYNGGLHMLSYWVAVFAEGVVRMYGSSFPAPYQQSFEHNLNLLYPDTAIRQCDTDNHDADGKESVYQIVILVLLILVGILLVGMVSMWWYFRKQIKTNNDTSAAATTDVAPKEQIQHVVINPVADRAISA